jgi:uroporphyrinogen-III decarboxylase
VTPLSSRERLTRLFQGQPIDRVPVWPLFPLHPLYYYADVHHEPSYAPVIIAAARCADVFDRRAPETGFCLTGSREIARGEERCERGGRRYLRRTVAWRGVTLSQEAMLDGERLQPVKQWVEEPAELARILAMPYERPEFDLARFATEREELGDRGLMMIDIGDPLQVLYRLMSVETFAVATLTDRALLLEFLDEMYRRYLDLYGWLLDHGVGPVYFIVGAEFAGPPVVSPADFVELSARYVKGVVDLIRGRGMYSIVHYHGNLRRVLEGMRLIGADGLHTVEAPPVGDCTLAQAREALGDMILVGNIQYDDFRRLDPDAMERLVARTIDEGGSGRFILSPTAGPYEQAITERMAANYVRFLEAGVKYGRPV